MWILFSPSEKKCLTHKNSIQPTKDTFYKDFICENLQEILESYTHFLKHASNAQLKKLFGTKTLNLNELSLAQNLFNTPLLDSIERYIGVAFNALDYTHLEKNAKNYIHEHLLIFSNLFGILRPQDKIPYYDLKQGEGFSYKNLHFSTKQFYANNHANIWEFLIKQQQSLEFLDLRASFYQKCFLLTKTPPTLKQHIHIFTLNFVKNGKTLSHYAKFYRGILLQTCAKNEISHLHNLLDLNLDGLILQTKEETTHQNISHTLLTYTIKDS